MATQNGRIVFNGAGERGYAGRGRYFLLVSAGAPVTLKFNQPNRGAGITLENVGVLKVGPVEDESYWQSVEILSTGAGTITFINGDDPVEFPNAVTVTGVTQITEAPSSVVVTPPDNPIAAATTETIAANGARKRIRIGVLSTETVSLRIREVGATGGGAEIQPGTNEPFVTTAALEVRNNDAAVASSYWIFEEL